MSAKASASDQTVATIARQVGYANAFALSVAFTRVRGVRPSEHRTRASASASAR
jgi:AraC-like DNA-binding protein